MIDTIKIYLLASILVFSFIGVLFLTDIRDSLVIESAQTYEQCVEEQYGMTPSKYYLEHNEYPRCQ